jgi:hypothetical protein
MSESVPEPAPEQGLDSRVSSLETGQENLSGKLDKILGIISGDGGHEGEVSGKQEGAGTTVAHEIREGVDRLKALADAAEAKSKTKPKAEPVEPEKAPVPPVRRITKWMWGSE